MSLGITPTYQEIKDFVTEQDLSSICTFDNVNRTNRFKILTTSDGLDAQISYPPFGYCAKSFIEYSVSDDMFIYRIAYFDENMEPLTREQFAVIYPSPQPATDYYGDKVIYWIKVPGSNNYNLSYATGAGTTWGDMFSTHLPVITKVG
jgi:hypothetical protein